MRRRSALAAAVLLVALAALAAGLAWTTSRWPAALLAVVLLGAGLWLSTQARPGEGER